MASKQGKGSAQDQKDQQSEESVYRSPDEQGSDDLVNLDILPATATQDSDFANIHLGNQRETIPGSLDSSADEPFSVPAPAWLNEQVNASAVMEFQTSQQQGSQHVR